MTKPIVYRQPPVAGGSPLTIVVDANVTSGVAPLGVIFDATGTTHADSGIDTFRSIAYSHDFGDSGAGSWTYYGVDSDKNVHRGGPLTAHVYETPGTYTYKVRGLDANGNVDQQEITITVTDPDTVYAGTDTICISTGTDMTGAPAGATQLTNQTSWPAESDNKRYLLRRGDDFSSFGAWSISGRTGVYIGAYGSGAKPIMDRFTGTYSYCRRVDLDMRSSLVGTKGTGTIGEDLGTGSYNVYCRNEWSNGALFAVIGSDGGDTGKARQGVVFYDCSVASTASTYPNNTGYGMYFVAGSYFAFLGWSFNSNLNYHPIRIPRGYKGVFQHCLCAVTNGDSSGNNGYDLFKWHAEGLDNWPADNNFTGLNPASAYGSIEENQFGNGTEAFSEAVTVEPQNDASAEGMEYFMMARNKFLKNFGTDFALGGRYLVARGNFMSSPATGSPNYNTNHHAGSLPPEWLGPYYTSDSDPTFSDPG
jgi:hypothetical protein